MKFIIILPLFAVLAQSLMMFVNTESKTGTDITKGTPVPIEYHKKGPIKIAMEDWKMLQKKFRELRKEFSNANIEPVKLYCFVQENVDLYNRVSSNERLNNKVNEFLELAEKYSLSDSDFFCMKILRDKTM